MVTIALSLMLYAGLAAEVQPVKEAVEFRQPQLASAFGKTVIAYGGGAGIYFASSPDSGRTFGPRVKVADTGALALGRHRGPRVTILRDSILVTAVAGKEVSKNAHAHGLPDQGDLVVWRSLDGGKVWTRTGVINDTPAAASEGLHAIAADAKGNLFAAWLDLRAAGTQLYGARSTDGGLTWGKNVLIYASPDGTICQCCDPSLAIDAKGQIQVMWRNALGGSRDLYLVHSADGIHFSAAEKLGEGTWKLDACPMDGGGIAVDHGEVVTAWRSGKEIFVAKPGRRELRVAEGKDVTVAAGAKGIYLAFSSDKGLQVLTPGSKVPVQIAAEGGYPNLVALGDGSVLAAWEENGLIHTTQLR